MIYKLVQVQTNPELEEHERRYGKWGDVPPGFREVTQAEFQLRHMGRVYLPERVEFRQFEFDGVRYSFNLETYHNQTGSAIRWDGVSPHYYLFGCDHQYVELSRPSGHRSGIHVDQCKLCGYTNSYDTSD